MDNQTVVSVLTFKGRARLIEEGGSQAWRADRRKLNHCEFIVCARHANSPFPAEGDEPHKSAFLVGRISGIVDADTDGEAHDRNLPNRNKILFSEYAVIDGPVLALTGQNPVQYWPDLAALGIDAATLEWQRVEAKVEKSPIERAKEMVAAAHGVTADRVDITIRF